MLTLFIVYALLLLLWSLRPTRADEGEDAAGETVAERSLEAALSPPEGAIRVARRVPALRA